jgi:hypothetical protein
MILRAKRFTRMTFISIIQQFFAISGLPDAQFPEQSPPVPASDTDFTWNADNKTTKITVVEHFPVQFRIYPIIVVDIVGGRSFFRSLNREFQEPLMGDVFLNGMTQTGVVGERYGGPLNLSVNIKVYDYNPKKVERITDKLISALRFLVFEKFRIAGIEITDINLVGESYEKIGNDPIFSHELNVEVYTEFEDTLSIAEAELIDKIQIPDVNGLITIVDGITDPNF